MGPCPLFRNPEASGSPLRPKPRTRSWFAAIFCYITCPPCGRLTTEAISVVRRREEGEREVKEGEIFLLLPLMRARVRVQERSESLRTTGKFRRKRERLVGERREGESKNLPLSLPHARVREENKGRRKRERGDRERERE